MISCFCELDLDDFFDEVDFLEVVDFVPVDFPDEEDVLPDTASFSVLSASVLLLPEDDVEFEVLV